MSCSTVPALAPTAPTMVPSKTTGTPPPKMTTFPALLSWMPKSGFPDCARVARSEVVLSKILAVVALSMARSTLPMSEPVLKLVTGFTSDLRGKESPRVRNALEFVLAALAERDAGAHDEILDRAGD